jgi:glycosyltransferase involved in cell wall biosynthesis
MIFNIPIEKYEERYTEQWSRWFPESYRELGLNFIDIQGEILTNKIENGQVLDYYGTHYYKYSQLMKLIKMIKNDEIKDDDILFFHDLWFPGIEGLQYIRDMSKKKFKIWGILHAGTWDKNDFTFLSGMRPWGRFIEAGWLNFFDKVFLGSEFHKKLIIKRNYPFKSELVVTGLPFKSEEVKRVQEKENIIVFPHRLDKEKRPDLFDKLSKKLSKKYPDWQFLKTKEETKTKEEYYQILGRSKIAISFAEQETFGYAMLEAIANGCYPIVPNKLSYQTMSIYNGFRFSNFKECLNMTEKAIQNSNQKIDLSQFEPVNIIKRIYEN